VWAGLRAEVGYAPSPVAQVSVQLVTKRRRFLNHAIRSVAQQQHVDFEVVLVTHGFALDPAEQDEIARLLGDRALICRQAPEGAVFGDALNTALAHSSGPLVAKWDDDDWYGPHHLEDLAQTLAWSSRATLAGVVQEYFYLAERDLTIHRPAPRVREPSHVGGGTMMIRREDLLGLGGWRPLRIPGPEDLSLSHAVRQSGGRIEAMHPLGFVLCRHGHDHTWVVDNDRFVEAADRRWSGFHPPPELGDSDVTDDHYKDIRARQME
jgi:hypothetical protein